MTLEQVLSGTPGLGHLTRRQLGTIITVGRLSPPCVADIGAFRRRRSISPRCVALAILLVFPCIVLPFVCFADCGTDSKTTVCNFPGLVVRSTADKMEVVGLSSTWVIDLNHLPLLPSDCSFPCFGANAGGYCVGACNGHWAPYAAAYHPPTGNLYFAVATDYAHNRPYVILRANTRTRQVHRIAAAWGAGVGMVGDVSPSGRYLAYVNFYAGGAGLYYSWIEVVDIQTLRRGKAARDASLGDEWNSSITSLKWVSERRLDFRADRVKRGGGESGTAPTEQVSGSVDVGLIDWTQKQ